MAEKKTPGVAAAVAGYVKGLTLSGPERVTAALAVPLGQSFEEAPPDARARIATELPEVLAGLADADLRGGGGELMKGIKR